MDKQNKQTKNPVESIDKLRIGYRCFLCKKQVNQPIIQLRSIEKLFLHAYCTYQSKNYIKYIDVSHTMEGFRVYFW